MMTVFSLGRGVAIVEEPARTQRHLHRLQIVLIDDARKHDRALPGG